MRKTPQKQLKLSLLVFRCLESGARGLKFGRRVPVLFSVIKFANLVCPTEQVVPFHRMQVQHRFNNSKDNIMISSYSKFHPTECHRSASVFSCIILNNLWPMKIYPTFFCKLTARWKWRNIFHKSMTVLCSVQQACERQDTC